jgi:chromosome partitioning protein
MTRIIAVCNQKGGVGKTTTAVNLGAYLALTGKRVLLVDFDPQANASSALGHDKSAPSPTIYHGLLGQIDPYSVIKNSPLHNYHFVPADQNLSGALVELVNLPEREFYLRKFIEKIQPGYDYIFIDLPPSISLISVNGLIAAKEVIIPVQAEYYSLEGLSQLLSTIGLINNNLGHNLAVAGALLTMHNPWEQLSGEVAKNLREKFPYYVYKTEIPRSVYLAEAPSFGKPIALYAPYSDGAVAYGRLAEEVINQENNSNI